MADQPAQLLPRAAAQAAWIPGNPAYCPRPSRRCEATTAARSRWARFWGADFPTASDFFGPALTCQSFYADPANTLNAAEYCNPHVDKLANEAQRPRLTDPAAARKLWARVDHIVTDQAPWVPLDNAAPTVFVSSRAGNYQESAGYGPLLDQTWVR